MASNDDTSDALLRFSPFQHSTHVFSVGELALRIAGVLDADPVLQDVWLRGEVVNVSRSPAGHYYFSLKEETSQLRCVLFRGHAFNSPVMPANGLAVVAHGAIHLYERQGSCELVTDLVFPEGVGLAQMQGERLYRQLETEGLFEPSRKRPLPRFPRRIGIVSSERGAVIHDLLSVLERWPRRSGGLATGSAVDQASTSSWLHVAAAQTTISPPSTTSDWRGPSLPARYRSCLPLATKRT